MFVDTHLEILKEDGVARPVHLREQVLVENFAHQLEQIHFALVVRLALQQVEQLRLPLPIVDRLHKLPDHRRHPGKDVAVQTEREPITKEWDVKDTEKVEEKDDLISELKNVLPIFDTLKSK